MKKIIIIIFTLAFILGGCADIDTNPNTSKDISAEVSAESAESADVSFESSESSESFEESFEDISNDASFEDVSAELSEDLSNDLSNDESKEADASSDVTDSSEDDESADNSSSAPPVSGGDNGNESKPVEDTSEPDVSEPIEDTSKVEPPAPHTHSYSATTVSPTCTEQGYKVYTCTCGDSYKADYVKARGHMWKGWIVTKEATLEAGGEETRTCWICKGTETRTTERLEPAKPVAIPVTPTDAEWLCNRILELLNEERAKLGAPALSTAPIAHEMAMVRANELTVVFSHKRPDGSDSRWIYLDYQYNPSNPNTTTVDGVEVSTCIPALASENIAFTGYYTKDSGNNSITTKEDLAVKIVEQFKASAGHWKDLTNPLYTGVGLGVLLVGDEYVPNMGTAYTCIMTMDKTYG